MKKHLKQFLKKFLCKHKWKMHTKQRYNIISRDGCPLGVQDIEVIICKQCGKIKKI